MIRISAQFDQKFQFDHQVKQDSIARAFLADRQETAK